MYTADVTVFRACRSGQYIALLPVKAASAGTELNTEGRPLQVGRLQVGFGVGREPRVRQTLRWLTGGGHGPDHRQPLTTHNSISPQVSGYSRTKVRGCPMIPTRGCG